MTIGLPVKVEIDLVGLARRRARRARRRPGAGRNLGWGRLACAGPSAQFAVDAFQLVGRAQSYPLGGRKVEHREAFRDGLLSPLGGFGCSLRQDSKVGLNKRSASEVAMSQPSPRRLPPASTPTAISTAQSLMRPSRRTLSLRPASSFLAARLTWVWNSCRSGPASVCSTSMTRRGRRPGHTSRPGRG